MTPEKVELQLLFGDPDRLRLAEISNWVGQGIAAPRTDLSIMLERSEVCRPGVYLLLGQDIKTGLPEAYIGEGDNLSRRLRQHTGKDFWSQAIAFTSRSDSFTKVHAKWLESKLLVEAEKVGRYKIANKTGSRSELPDFERGITEDFFRRVKQLLPVLGTTIVTEVSKGVSSSSARYTYKVKKAVAHGERTPAGFVIFEGSTAMASDRPGAAKHGSWVLRLRAELVASEALRLDGDIYRFTRDVEFASPSAAAAVVAGGPAAGPIAWKDRQGKTLKENEAE